MPPRGFNTKSYLVLDVVAAELALDKSLKTCILPLLLPVPALPKIILTSSLETVIPDVYASVAGTCKSVFGVVVPIPTFPVLDTRKRSVKVPVSGLPLPLLVSIIKAALPELASSPTPNPSYFQPIRPTSPI